MGLLGGGVFAVDGLVLDDGVLAAARGDGAGDGAALRGSQAAQADGGGPCTSPISTPGRKQKQTVTIDELFIGQDRSIFQGLGSISRVFSIESVEEERGRVVFF